MSKRKLIPAEEIEVVSQDHERQLWGAEQERLVQIERKLNYQHKLIGLFGVLAVLLLVVYFTTGESPADLIRSLKGAVQSEIK